MPQVKVTKNEHDYLSNAYLSLYLLQGTPGGDPHM